MHKYPSREHAAEGIKKNKIDLDEFMADRNDIIARAKAGFSQLVKRGSGISSESTTVSRSQSFEAVLTAPTLYFLPWKDFSKEIRNYKVLRRANSIETILYTVHT